MKLEDQVASLEFAKQMKELGFKQESLWCWNKEIADEEYEINQWQGKFKETSYSAYTVAELGEMLPNYMLIVTWPKLMVEKKIVDWQVESIANLYQDKIPPLLAKTEADARAKMLCFLKKENLIKD